MAYVLLIMEDRKLRKSWSREQAMSAYERMQSFVATLEARGVYKVSHSLRPDEQGARVERRGGKPIVIDGPYAEAKEMVGGFFLLDGVTKEQAIALAAECPAAEFASVEVREVGPCYEQ
jgi:hypothetical protein